MPARRTDKASERTEPYNLRRSTMAVALVSPMPQQWPGMTHQAQVHDWPQYPHPYQQPTTLAGYNSSLLTTPALTMQATQSQSAHHRRVSHSHSNSQGSEGPWTAEMDSILIDAHARGLRWEQISMQHFPQKSANACRKRFGRAKEERRATGWDDNRITKVINTYNKEGFREQFWGMLARETGERWQDLEKVCYSQGMSRMVRTRPGHARARSRVSSGHHMDDSRYPSSNDEYDHHDDSGIGLGLLNPSHHHHHHHNGGPVGQSTVTTGASLDQMLVAPSHYTYTSR